MKKIKYLHAFVIGLIVIYILFFIGNAYITFFTNLTHQFEELYKTFIFGYYTQFVGIFFSVFTFIGLVYIEKGVRITVKKGFFNAKSSQHFITAGKYFLVSGILGGVFDLVIFFCSDGVSGFASLGLNFLLIIMAFVLYIIADIIKNGNELKTENDLTI